MGRCLDDIRRWMTAMPGLDARLAFGRLRWFRDREGEAPAEPKRRKETAQRELRPPEY